MIDTPGSPSPTDDAFASLLLDASPDGLLLVDANGRIQIANRAATAIFGYSHGDLVGMLVDELVPIERRSTHAHHRRTYSDHPTGRPMGTDLQLHAQQRDGSTIPVEISLNPMTVDGEVQTVATVRDVSERQETLARVALLKDRERIAHDLHDLVIQRLFAVGMSLQSVMGLIDSSVARDRINSATDELDDTVRAVRTAIFHLGHTDTTQSLTSHVAELVDERSRHLGFTPDLIVDGPIDDLPEFIADQLVATLTEALSNVVRHAHATDVDVTVTFRDGNLRLAVTDNGTGITNAPKPLGGLSNMMWRAAELGGSCTVAPSTPSGTQLVWHVPV